MVDNLLRTAGHWSDTDVRQKIIHEAARILGSRGSDKWLDGFERLRSKLHLAPGILEHQTVTESIERDRNRQGYARARVDEINDETRRKAPARGRHAVRGVVEQRTAALSPTPHSATENPSAGPDPAAPSR